MVRESLCFNAVFMTDQLTEQQNLQRLDAKKHDSRLGNVEKIILDLRKVYLVILSLPLQKFTN